MVCKVLASQYGLCFKTYFFPLKTSELVNSLEKRGYEISPRIPFPRPPVALSGSGTIARKGRTVIFVDSRSQVLSIATESVKNALDTCNEIINMLKEDYQIDLESLTGVYEFVVQCEASTDKQASETIAKNVKIPILNQVREIFKKEVQSTAIKFSGAGMKSNSGNWFEFSVEPNFTRDDSYLVNVTHRTEKKEESISFIESIEENINRIIELIDK
jgi:hypothetical protein